MINYDMTRGVRVRHGRYSSDLVVAEAQKHDSGNYSCVPSNAHPASISVHILNGIVPNPWYCYWSLRPRVGSDISLEGRENPFSRDCWPGNRAKNLTP